MATAHNGDVELHYETFGSGDDPTLLLVNGLGSQCINYAEPWCQRFVDAGYQVVRFDNRDVGLSSKLDGIPYTLTDMADDAVAVLDAVGVSRAHVMGCSMGGMIVQRLAIEHPDRVLTMTSVMSGTGEPEYGKSSPEALAFLLAAPATSRQAAIDNHVAAIAVYGSRPDWIDEAETRARAAAAYDRCFCPAGIGRQMKAVMADPPRADALRALSVPTLVLHGSRDCLIDPSGGRRTAELIPGARYVEIEGMGHDYPPPVWDQWVSTWADFAAQATASWDAARNDRPEPGQLVAATTDGGELQEARTMVERMVCSPRALPPGARTAAAVAAGEVNPANLPAAHGLLRVVGDAVLVREAIAAVTTKYWHGASGVRLSVGFLDGPPAELRKRILEHMNAWGTTANVRFTQAKTDPAVRIARGQGADGGYWSYLGTDILQIAPDQPTMNLEGFTVRTPDAELRRVVRHETGHTLGFPHEHLRAALVAKIDPDKAIALFEATQGWSEAEVRAQVLTPIEESTLVGTRADPRSIMCYQLPGSITKDGMPIVGGTDIDATDHAFAARLYPKRAQGARRPQPSGATTSAPNSASDAGSPKSAVHT